LVVVIAGLTILSFRVPLGLARGPAKAGVVNGLSGVTRAAENNRNAVAFLFAEGLTFQYSCLNWCNVAWSKAGQ
jgi:hypothetical protein